MINFTSSSFVLPTRFAACVDFWLFMLDHAHWSSAVGNLSSSTISRASAQLSLFVINAEIVLCRHVACDVEHGIAELCCLLAKLLKFSVIAPAHIHLGSLLALRGVSRMNLVVLTVDLMYASSMALPRSAA